MPPISSGLNVPNMLLTKEEDKKDDKDTSFQVSESDVSSLSFMTESSGTYLIFINLRVYIPPSACSGIIISSYKISCKWQVMYTYYYSPSPRDDLYPYTCTQ